MEDISNRSLSISRVFDAPIDLVWEAWSNPEHIKHWWGPAGFTNTIEYMDFTPGGHWKFVMHGPDGTDYKNEHIYIEIEKHQKIVMDHVTGPKFRTTVHFFAEGEQTRIEWQAVFESAAVLQQVIKSVKADEGLKQNVERLGNYIKQLKSNG